MGLANINTYELFFHHEFVNTPEFPQEKKAKLQQDGPTFFIPGDFTVYQEKMRPYESITESDFRQNRGSFFRTLYHLQYNKVEPFIEFHFDKYSGNKKDFIDFAYNLLQGSRTTQGNIELKPFQQKIMALTWLEKKKSMLLQNQLEEKKEFLRKAYEAAYEHHPSGPLSVQIDPIACGDSLGFDKNTSKRIVKELGDEGFATSGLGMRFLMVTKLGLNYLHNLEVEKPNPAQPINFHVGDNSTANVIIQSPGASIFSNTQNEIIDKAKTIINTIENDNSIDNTVKQKAIIEFNNLISEVEQGKPSPDTINSALSVSANIASVGSLVISLIQLFMAK